MMRSWVVPVVALAVFVLFKTESAFAATQPEHCPEPAGAIVSAQGLIEVREAGAQRWMEADLDALVCPGDSIRVGERSRAAVLLFDIETVLRLDENTTLRLAGDPEQPASLIDMLRGAIHFLSRVPRALEVRTPYVNGGVEGTEFAVRVDERRTVITVFEGKVAARNERGRLLLERGKSAVASAGEAPELRVVARPRDAVQWALHYKPVISARPALAPSPELAAALEAWARGDFETAFEQLDAVPEARRDAVFHIYRAAVLLDVGRVERARAGIDRALELAPDSGDAYALRAVIAIARNERERALAGARRAVELSPDSASARIALSYALQADFELEAARDVLLEAAERRPDDALVWARLAEIWLSLGYRGRALEAAETARSLSPDLARTNTVLGFAALAQVQLSRAREAFGRAIARASADPLPRLGLGLAKIRESELTDGRQEIEVAAALDPDNALLRSYLGKAYFEETRDELAAEQFELAMELDPNDPTSWFYDAIREQTVNQPTDAVEDLQASIERNDNRAVYRSRLLLDEDLAVRGTSLARVYDDLGFDRLAFLEASKSLTLDPSNAAAHRFLADSFRRRPLQETGRVSALLQSQLLQPLNVRPVQPSVSETDLNILAGAGPAETAFNEFTPLFARDQLDLVASGAVGNNDTLSDEVVVSGIQGRTSFSLGQFHFETDGFRANNDLNHDIVDAFGQVQVTPDLGLQVEYRRRDSEQGDLTLEFDPDDFSRTDSRSEDEDTVRVGAHWQPSPRSDVIASFIYEDRLTKVSQVLIPGLVTREERSDQEGLDGQVQAQFRGDWFNVLAGGSLSDVDLDQTEVFDALGPPVVTKDDIDIDQQGAYAYANINFPDDVMWTLGLAYDSFDREPIDADEVNPKFGVQWNITDRLRLRAAAFKTLKRVLLADQTLEPTQVAGFTQFFDDPNAAEAWRYGAGLDAVLADGLYAGVEVSHRDVDRRALVPGPGGTRVDIRDRDDRLYRGYLYWIPFDDWAISLEPQFETFDLEDSPGPERVETVSVPLGVRYFDDSGAFAELQTTFVHQDVDPSVPGTIGDDSDAFALVDAAVGYRFSERRGIASLEVRNLFDEKFRFQDLNFANAGRPVSPRFIPDRTFLVRLTLAF